MTDKKSKPAKIEKFSGEYRWLSNFFGAKVTYNGKEYKTVEHAYQAAKTLDLAVRKKIREAGNPAQAKKMGRKAKLRPDWEKKKVGIMKELVAQKFQEPTLKQKLLDTGDAELIEGNHWGDTFWGVTEKGGQNHLGKILMEVREGLKSKSKSDPGFLAFIEAQKRKNA